MEVDDIILEPVTETMHTDEELFNVIATKPNGDSLCLTNEPLRLDIVNQALNLILAETDKGKTGILDVRHYFDTPIAKTVFIVCTRTYDVIVKPYYFSFGVHEYKAKLSKEFNADSVFELQLSNIHLEGEDKELIIKNAGHKVQEGVTIDVETITEDTVVYDLLVLKAHASSRHIKLGLVKQFLEDLYKDEIATIASTDVSRISDNRTVVLKENGKILPSILFLSNKHKYNLD